MRKLLFLVAIFLFTFITACHKDSLLNTSNLSLPEEVVETGKRHCGTDEYHEHLMKTDESYRLTHAQIEEQVARFVANYDEQIQSRAVITIPVVFHVLYNNRSVDSISITVIDNLLASLTKDFRRMNRDTASTPAEFKSVAADLEIQFVRAKRTPNGLSSSGVEYRKLNNKTFLGESSVIKSYTQGGLNAWNATQYLNIWTCEMSAITSYATFPANLASQPTLDGVVLDYRTIPGVPNAFPSLSLGRILTHELGHWLGLYHTFQGGCNGSGDFIADTPAQMSAAFGCPINRNTCPTAGNDMVNNYMDFTDDACMNLFTKGQKARVWSIFAQGGARVKLLTSLGAVAGLEPTKCYRLINRNSGLALDISLSNNINAIQYSLSSTTNQRWSLSALNDNAIKITNKRSNLVLRASQTLENTTVIQGAYSSGGSSDWKVSYADNGYIRLQHVLSGKYLGVFGSSKFHSASIVVQTLNAANLAQQWQIVEIPCL